MQVSVVPASFDVAVASVSPPPHDALELGLALMEVMRETAVSFSTIMTNSWNTVSCPAVHAPQWAWTTGHKTMKHNNYQHL